eukprot:CAMPEP_0203885464 /NCGR_PEP_ID=MMETSP0359-20131031/29401_1 /ASSEMBLY_ACC=CAM_ASM_000338 /TAXON_ID=268821 /ORGANISM="Scrippsiella Hangoei, Strain SHTV-5" /LENGTH=220 /DNA_ID=CAMNT_0050806087 /DNA_START=8 /DNA_END=667 /DNA_ORIENTATION=-
MSCSSSSLLAMELAPGTAPHNHLLLPSWLPARIPRQSILGKGLPLGFRTCENVADGRQPLRHLVKGAQPHPHHLWLRGQPRVERGAAGPAEGAQLAGRGLVLLDGAAAGEPLQRLRGHLGVRSEGSAAGLLASRAMAHGKAGGSPGRQLVPHGAAQATAMHGCRRQRLCGRCEGPAGSKWGCRDVQARGLVWAGSHGGQQCTRCASTKGRHARNAERERE